MNAINAIISFYIVYRSIQYEELENDKLCNYISNQLSLKLCDICLVPEFLIHYTNLLMICSQDNIKINL